MIRKTKILQIAHILGAAMILGSLCAQPVQSSPNAGIAVIPGLADDIEQSLCRSLNREITLINFDPIFDADWPAHLILVQRGKLSWTNLDINKNRDIIARAWIEEAKGGPPQNVPNRERALQLVDKARDAGTVRVAVSRISGDFPYEIIGIFRKFDNRGGKSPFRKFEMPDLVLRVRSAASDSVTIKYVGSSLTPFMYRGSLYLLQSGDAALKAPWIKMLPPVRSGLVEDLGTRGICTLNQPHFR